MVIQGSFPHGIAHLGAASRIAPAVQASAARPGWVQQRIAAGGRVAPVAPVTQPATARTPQALRLGPNMSAFARAGGQPLPQGVRQMMEAVFGTAFNQVRVHVGPHAATMGALAFTQGFNIHFAPGQYAPDTARGRQILAHELTHVVQQRAGRVRNPFDSGVAVVLDGALEAEADRMALRVAMYRPPVQMKRFSRPAPLHLRSSRFPIQRKVVNADGTAANEKNVCEWAEEHMGEVLDFDQVEGELETENDRLGEERMSIAAFLAKIGFGNVPSAMDEADDDWDPADEAADPLEPDDILSSDVRKALCFDKAAKLLMKTDTPKNKTGGYVCHICKKDIVKGQKVDMDHLPPWKERLRAFITVNNLTEDEMDEVSGPNMKRLYNLRGSVFAHSSCNRNHSGEENYLTKRGGVWPSAAAWIKADGGAPFK